MSEGVMRPLPEEPLGPLPRLDGMFESSIIWFWDWQPQLKRGWWCNGPVHDSPARRPYGEGVTQAGLSVFHANKRRKTKAG